VGGAGRRFKGGCKVPHSITVPSHHFVLSQLVFGCVYMYDSHPLASHRFPATPRLPHPLPLLPLTRRWGPTRKRRGYGCTNTPSQRRCAQPLPSPTHTPGTPPASESQRRCVASTPSPPPCFCAPHPLPPLRAHAATPAAAARHAFPFPPARTTIPGAGALRARCPRTAPPRAPHLHHPPLLAPHRPSPSPLRPA
jgi:hypothetical protein